MRQIGIGTCLLRRAKSKTPNRDDDPAYLLRLIGQVISVSLETVKIVTSLLSLGLPEATATETATAGR
jgi:hypothetical protein